jgi:glucose-1-phosphate thymidylyltransferase
VSTAGAVVLAAGLGSRMRAAPGPGVELSPEQLAAAQQGLKGMIPLAGGRPFLDYVLSGLADAGCAAVCLVIGGSEAHQAIRARYGAAGPARPERFELSFAVQRWPLGTADAVLAAERFAGAEPVLVLNADNLYPTAALRTLAALPRAGLLGFRRSTLLERGNIPVERIAAFALIETGSAAELSRIVEKPAPDAVASFGADPLVSMNAWLLPPTIYAACRAVRPSPRGELELVDAVRHSIEQQGERYRVIESQEGVLDLSSPADIAVVAGRLRGVEVRL